MESRPMKIHVVSMVRDEEDIVEAFVRHTAHYVDAMHIVLHQSLDGTRAILEALQKEGMPLRLTVSTEPGFRQGATLTSLAREAFRAGADIVLPIDADEFIRAPSREALERALSVMPAGASGGMFWQTYVPLPDDAHHASVPRRITHRRARETSPVGKLALGRGFHEDDTLLLVEGAHFLFRKEGGQFVQQPLKWIPDVHVAHFPIRSVDQIVAKMLMRRWQRRIGWEEGPIAILVASGTRSMFDRMTEVVLERGSLSGDELSWLAYCYNEHYSRDPAPSPSSYRHLLVHDPCPSAVAELKYTPANAGRSPALYRWIDQLVAGGALRTPATPAAPPVDPPRPPATGPAAVKYSFSFTQRKP